METRKMCTLVSSEIDYWTHRESSDRVLNDIFILDLLLFSLHNCISKEYTPSVKKGMIYHYLAKGTFRSCNDIIALLYQHSDESIHTYNDRVKTLKEYLLLLMNYIIAK